MRFAELEIKMCPKKNLGKKQKSHWVKSVRVRSYSDPHFFRILPHSDRIRRDTPYLSVFNPNAGKSGKNADQKNPKTDTFYSVTLQIIGEVYCFWKTGSFQIWKITFQEVSWKDFAKYKRSYIYRRKEKTHIRYCHSYLFCLDMLSKPKSKFTWMGTSSQWVKESFMEYRSLIRHSAEQYRFFWDQTVILRRKKLHLIHQKRFTNLTSNHYSDNMI